MMQKNYCLFWSFVLLIALTTWAGARTIYVSPTGNDTTGDGSSGNPYRTIQKGIDMAAPSGDTVEVAAGTYVENVVWEAKSLTLHGTGAGQSIVDGNGTGSCLVLRNVPATARVEGFTFQNGQADSGGGLYLYNSDATLIYITVTSNTANYGGGLYLIESDATLTYTTTTGNHADYYGGGIEVIGSAPTLTYNTIAGNEAYNGGGLWLNASAATLTHNTITGNEAGYYGGGLDLESSAPTLTHNAIMDNFADWGGGMCLADSPATLTNNTVTDNFATYQGGGLYLVNANATMTNNTIAGNTGGGVYNEENESPGSPTITNCILWGNGGSGDLVGASATYSDIGTGNTSGAGNISADPLFVGGGDYHLQTGSPCINAGSNAAASLPTTDIDGEPRILYATVDMGADEVSHLKDLQPDLWILQGSSWRGDNIYNDDGLNQTGYRAISPGNTVVYQVRLQNDGEETESFWIKGPAGDENWTVRYYWGTTVREDREVTNKVTSGRGWKTYPAVLPEQLRHFLITVTPNSGVVSGSYTALVTAQSDLDPTQQDTLKVVTQILSLQPDLWILQGTSWLGNNLYNSDGSGQEASYRVAPGSGATVVYQARLENDEEEAENFWIKGPAGDENWTVRYYWGTTVREDREVTSKVTGPWGWKNSDVLPGEIRHFLITVTPNSEVVSGSYTALVTAESERDPTRRDSLKAFTRVFPSLQPDLWILQGTSWLGDNVYNNNGYNQTGYRTVLPGNTVVYQARLENDEEEAENFWIKGPAGDENWTVRYYWGTTVREDREVTSKVTGPWGWKTYPIVLPGEIRQFLITVTPSSGASGSYTALVTVQSDRDPLQRDALKTLTQVQ